MRKDKEYVERERRKRKDQEEAKTVTSANHIILKAR